MKLYVTRSLATPSWLCGNRLQTTAVPFSLSGHHFFQPHQSLTCRLPFQCPACSSLLPSRDSSQLHRPAEPCHRARCGPRLYSSYTGSQVCGICSIWGLPATVNARLRLWDTATRANPPANCHPELSGSCLSVSSHRWGGFNTGEATSGPADVVRLQTPATTFIPNIYE